MGWSDKFLGVTNWIWALLGFSTIFISTVLIWYFKEKFKKYWYKIRYPEQLIKIVIHYDTRIYREYYRLIPTSDSISIGSKKYAFDSKAIQQVIENYGINNELWIDGKKYNYTNMYGIKKRKDFMPELHYFFNNPQPIDFNIDKGKINLTSRQLMEFQENDLLHKLLTLETERKLLTVVLLLCLVSAGASVFVLLKMYEIL